MLNNKIADLFAEIILINFILKSLKKSSFETKPKYIIRFALIDLNYINVMSSRRLL